MTDIDENTCTAVTILFEGPNHRAAADAFVIQFSDGGLDQGIEERLQDQGFTVADTDFNTGARTLTIKLGD